MRIIDLALKDLLQTVRDKMSAVFIIAMPVIFTVFFGLMFGPPNPDVDNRLQVALINQDLGGELASSLVSSLDSSDFIRLVDTLPEDRDKTLSSISSEKIAALVEIPAGYSEQLFSGNTADIIVTAANNTQPGITAQSIVQTALGRMQGSIESARLAAGNVEKSQPFETDAARREFLQQSYQLASELWKSPAVGLSSANLQSGKPQSFAPSGFAQSSPGLLVQFAIFGLLIPGTVVVSERNSRTFQRLLTTPLSRTGAILGHGLAFFSIVFIQEFILIAIAQAFLGVNYLQQPLGVLMVMVALALMAASLGMLIAIVAKKEQQVILYSLVAMFLLAALGGAWFPLEVAGKTFSNIGHLLPSAWAMDAFQNLIIRGLGIESILLPVAIILGYAVLFAVLSIWRFSRE